MVRDILMCVRDITCHCRQTNEWVRMKREVRKRKAIRPFMRLGGQLSVRVKLISRCSQL